VSAPVPSASVNAMVSASAGVRARERMLVGRLMSFRVDIHIDAAFGRIAS
jgi:hypothetical protein